MHGTIEAALRVEWRPLADLASIAVEWRELAARAIEPNVFYEPAFALAAAPVFGSDVGAGLVWLRTRLVGFFPARVERRRYGLMPPILVGWTHPYGPLGAPLVDREMCERVIAAWFDHVATNPRLPKLMLLPYLPAAGAPWRLLSIACWRSAVVRASVSRATPARCLRPRAIAPTISLSPLGRRSARSCCGSESGLAIATG